MKWFWLPERLPAVSPAFMRCLHFWLAALWCVMIPLSLFFGLIYSIVFISAVSIYANLVGHWSGWSAERPEEVGGAEDHD